MNPSIEKSLFVFSKDEYGDKYNEHLLEQYKTFIISAEKIDEQRLKTNQFFLAINTTLVTLFGFIVSTVSSIEISLLLIPFCVAGIATCYLWRRIIMAKGKINNRKYQIIIQIEKHLPATLYGEELNLLGVKKDSNLYRPFTKTERRVPKIFIAIYISMAAFYILISAYNFVISNCI